MEEINDEMQQFHSIVNFEGILRIIDEAFFLLNKSYLILYANPAAETLLNSRTEQLSGKNLLDLLPLDPDLATLLIEAISEHGKLEANYFFKGNSKWYQVTAYPLKREFALIFKDINSQKIVEQELREREAALKVVLDSIPNMGWTCAPTGEVISMNKRWEEYTGIPAEYGFDSLWFDAVHPDDVEDLKKKWHECVRSGQIFECEYRFRRYDGEYRWFLDRTVPTFDEQNNLSLWIGTATDVHEQKLAKEKLKESETYLRKILDTISQIAWISSPNGEPLMINKRWKEYTGLENEASSSAPAVHPDDINLIREQWVDSVRTGTECENLYRIRDINGEYRWHIARTRPLYNDQNEIELWVGTATDIHEQKLAEEKLQESERHLREVLDTIPHIIFIVSQGGEIVYFNKQWSEYRGLLEDANKSPSWEKAVDPKDIDELADLGKNSNESGNGFQHEYRLQNSKGTYRWHIINVIPLKNEEGSIIQWIATASDIHDRKLAEQELRETNKFIKKITGTSPALITVYDFLEKKYIYSNEEIDTYLGVTKTELLGLSIEEILERIHPEDRHRFLSIRVDYNNLDDDDIREYEFRAKNDQGEWVWLKSRSKVFDRDKAGNVRQIISITDNISTIKKAQQELDYSNNFIYQITQATPDFIAVFDLATHKYAYVNDKVFQYWGISKERMYEMNFDKLMDFIHPEDRNAWWDHIQQVVHANNDEITEIKYRTYGAPETGYIWIKTRSKVFRRDEKGKVEQIITLNQNITAELEAEEAVKEKQRIQSLMEQKDELFSIASHELKTPITSMKAGLQIVKRQVEKKEDPEVLLVFLTQAIKQVNKLSALIADLLDITKIQAGKLKLNISKFYLTEVISEVAIQNSNSHKIEISDNLNEPIEADKARIEQVIINYISNAIKYSPGSDRILVSVDQDGDFVKVSVKDFGIGIPKDKLDKVFDRFYRADETSQRFSGLGLGLYISSEIIDRHHGKYGVISEEGKGSTFWFSIPVRHSK
jgi:PAS domain S-box-containing protein